MVYRVQHSSKFIVCFLIPKFIQAKLPRKPFTSLTLRNSMRPRPLSPKIQNQYKASEIKVKCIFCSVNVGGSLSVFLSGLSPRLGLCTILRFSHIAARVESCWESSYFRLQNFRPTLPFLLCWIVTSH